ncbi:MAG: class I SAM-dependent methyltransferase, partial [Gemmatimonadetes bacterium]|nr:class I SAM-dependent methyltransferase [Gemmatimonadota bacterium]
MSLSPSPVTPRSGRPNTTVVARVCRKLLFDRLAMLGHGAIEIRETWDDGEKRRFGDREGGAVEAAIHTPDFYRSAVARGPLGIAESFMRGEWTSPDLVGVMRFFLRNQDVLLAMESGVARLAAPLLRLAHRKRRNDRSGSRRNIREHYDIGNDFFSLMLDETMTYSCALFDRADEPLHEASTRKLDRLCAMLQLEPGHRLLEIGTGWGSLALHAAGKYGCRVTTTTISREQARLARERIAARGLERRIQVVEQDYRDLTGKYDRLISIEMIEAIGHEHLDDYFTACDRLLAPGGRMALQAITMNDTHFDYYVRAVDFIQKYVFPGSCLLSVRAMKKTLLDTSLSIENVLDIGQHYPPTLQAWRHNVETNRAEIRALGYD